VCTRAQVHLQRMGVLEDILAAKQGRWASVGGFVSPSGIRVIGTSAQHMPTPVVIAIKRLVLDEKIARAAVRAGATLVEEAPVARAVFAAAQGIWTIHCRPKHPQVITGGGDPGALARSLAPFSQASQISLWINPVNGLDSLARRRRRGLGSGGVFGTRGGLSLNPT